MLCDKVKHRFDRKEGQQFAIRVHKIMRYTLFSFSWVELNNADLDIADQMARSAGSAGSAVFTWPLFFSYQLKSFLVNL